MENKEVVTVQKITQRLIGYWFLWTIVLGIFYSIVFSLITKNIDSMISLAIITIVLQGITIFCIWMLSTTFAFKTDTIARNDVPTVMKNMLIFTIIICVINAIYNFYTLNTKIEESLNSNPILKYQEDLMYELYNSDVMEEYRKQKNAEIKEAKREAYTYLAVIEIGLTAVYLGVLPLEKREILKHVS